MIETQALRGLDSSIGSEAIRAMRPKTFAAFDAVHNLYLHGVTNADTLSVADRAYCASTAAALVPNNRLAAEYRQEFDAVKPDDPPPYWPLFDQHIAMMVSAPATASKAQVDALLAAGLSVKQLMELVQIVAFVTYQARVLHGMRLWQEVR